MSLSFTFKSRQYTRAGVYGEWEMHVISKSIAFNGLILGTEFEEVEEAQKEVKKERKT